MENAKKSNYRLNIGLVDGDDLNKTYDFEKACKELARLVTGATVRRTTGIYKGRLEDSMEVDLYDVTEATVYSVARHFNKLLNQESIAISKLTPLPVDFYSEREELASKKA